MQYEHLLRKGDICFVLKNEIAPTVKVSDFSSMQKEKGRQQICPKTLTLITLLQFIEGLSDRACLTNLRFRLDWKIALGLEVDDEGFHHSTLSNFRKRLVECEAAGYIFDRVLEVLIEKKLVKAGQKQRIDSTHVIGLLAELSRIELMHETLRLFFKEVSLVGIVLSERLDSLATFYSSDIGTQGLSDVQRSKFLSEAGQAMLSIIEVCSETGFSILADLESFRTLKAVFEQNYTIGKTDKETTIELIKVATGKDHICSPHEPEARHANKGRKGWTGYKAQIAETVACEQHVQSFITYAEATESTEYDGNSIEPFLQETAANNASPDQVFADTHYNTADNIVRAELEGTELKGPVAPNNRKPKAENEAIKIDFDEQKASCPKNLEIALTPEGKSDRLKGSFPKDECHPCPFSDHCKPEPRGKKVRTKKPNAVLEKRRNDMKQPGFKETNQNPRNAIEGTISALVRGQGLRNARYRGLEKTNLQVKFSAAAANVKRLTQMAA